jgi:hypothetical protein
VQLAAVIDMPHPSATAAPYFTARASSAFTKQASGARTVPAPIWPTPGSREAMPVLMIGVIDVSTTLRISIPSGAPWKSQVGIGRLGLLRTVISAIASLVARASGDPRGGDHAHATEPEGLRDGAVSHVGAGLVLAVTGEVQALRGVDRGGEPFVPESGDPDAEVLAISGHRGDHRAFFDRPGSVHHRLTRRHGKVEEELVGFREELLNAGDGGSVEVSLGQQWRHLLGEERRSRDVALMELVAHRDGSGNHGCEREAAL